VSAALIAAAVAGFIALVLPARAVRAATPSPASTFVTVSSRSVSAMRVQPVRSDSTVDGEVRDMYVKGDSLEVVFANTGRKAVAIVGEVQVRGADDELLLAIPLDSASVAAGKVRKMRVAMPALAKGSYVMYAVIDFGGTDLTAAQAALEIR
jgi:hypothetical protein